MNARVLYIGVDVHEKESQVAVDAQDGEILQEKRLTTFVSSLEGGNMSASNPSASSTQSMMP